MKTFLAKMILASLLMAMLVSCSNRPATTTLNVDKSPTGSACSMQEPASNVKHWEAFKNQNVEAIIATYDPASKTLPSVSDLNAYFVQIKSAQITLDSVTWVATCPLPDGSSYSFFLVTGHNPSKAVTQWYVLTTNSAGLLENVE